MLQCTEHLYLTHVACRRDCHNVNPTSTLARLGTNMYILTAWYKVCRYLVRPPTWEGANSYRRRVRTLRQTSSLSSLHHDDNPHKRINATRRASSFLAEHDVATFNLANNPPPVANAGLGSYSRALEFTSMALSSSETNNMKVDVSSFLR